MKSALQPVELECDKCDFKVGDLSKLKSHLRINHTDVKCTQTDEVELVDQHVQLFASEFSDDKCVQTFEEFSSVEEDKSEEVFEKYPCFYCGINIARRTQQKM